MLVPIHRSGRRRTNDGWRAHDASGWGQTHRAPFDIEATVCKKANERGIKVPPCLTRNPSVPSYLAAAGASFWRHSWRTHSVIPGPATLTLRRPTNAIPVRPSNPPLANASVSLVSIRTRLVHTRWTRSGAHSKLTSCGRRHVVADAHVARHVAVQGNRHTQSDIHGHRKRTPLVGATKYQACERMRDLEATNGRARTGAARRRDARTRNPPAEAAQRPESRLHGRAIQMAR